MIPHSIHEQAVFGFDFDGYWQDIGTIRSFYDTNLELTAPNSPFNFYDARQPIYTHSRFLPGSIVEDSRLTDVLLTEGCVIRKAEISHSIIGLRSQIGAGTRIKDSILMGADYYQRQYSACPLGIGANCHIEGRDPGQERQRRPRRRHPAPSPAAPRWTMASGWSRTASW